MTWRLWYWGAMSTQIDVMPKCGRGLVLGTLVLLAAAAETSAQAQNKQPDQSGSACAAVAEVREVADGVFVRPGRHAVVFEQAGIANIGFVVGRRCVAVIDTGGSAAEGEALRCAIARITPLPVCYVINTHAHPDHLLGNTALRGPDVTFVGHANLARDLALVGATYLQRAAQAERRALTADDLVTPTRTVRDRVVLDLGARRLELHAYPPAHSTSDLAVLDLASGTLWAGDLVFSEHIPVLAGNLRGWLQALRHLAVLPARQVVAGHGPVSGAWPVAAADTRRYLTVLRDEIKRWLADGGDLWDAQRQLAARERGRWRLSNRYHQRNIAHAFNELEWED